MNRPNENSPNKPLEHLGCRPRRLRQTSTMRQLLRNVFVRPADLIMPLFVTSGTGIKEEIKSMPGQFRFSIDQLQSEIADLDQLGLRAVMLFGIPESKDSMGSDAWNSDGIIQQAIREIRKSHPDLIIIGDVCLCEYTDHGHCGIVNDPPNHQNGCLSEPRLPSGYVLNEPTLELLQRIALAQAAAGIDIVAPSGMMDGMVGAIRQALDLAGYNQIPVMSYSVKYSSSFYGPFRDAADGVPQFGDRRTHQMDFAESRQPLLEAELDIQQSADFLMVKPALAYLDVLRDLRVAFPNTPLVAYNVSGEYSMVKAASAKGWLDEQAVVEETLTGIKRAGADLIITYHAKDYCRWQK